MRLALLRRQCRLRLAQIERQLKAVDAETARMLAGDEGLARRAELLVSIPGVGRATAAGLLAAMPELGGLDAKAAASLAGLAPVARESGQWRGKRFIQGGRARVRRLLHMAAVEPAAAPPAEAAEEAGGPSGLGEGSLGDRSQGPKGQPPARPASAGAQPQHGASDLIPAPA